MKILLTGANGYIGTRLLPYLLKDGHEVYALVRRGTAIIIPKQFQTQLHVLEADLLIPSSLMKIPVNIDAAYYLVHSMSYSQKFSELETASAKNFVSRLENTNAKQIIYLSGLSNEAHLSPHLTSRKQVGEILKMGKIPVTILMAGIIIGSGSASFEIIRDLVEKLPIMIAPQWLKHLTQPIAVRDVLNYLTLILGNPNSFNKSYEIGGPDVMTYKDLLLNFAQTRGLKRKIFTVPVLTPRLSSYWLFFITSTSFSLARFLVESLKNNVLCKENRIAQLFPKNLLSYKEAVKLAFSPIEDDWMPPSWKDNFKFDHLSIYFRVPQFGILSYKSTIFFSCPVEQVQERMRSLGKDLASPAMTWCWKLINFLGYDQWRILLSDEKKRILLLYAVRKFPGEAWLEWEIIPYETGGNLKQTAALRPRGVSGRIFWYALYPLHALIWSLLARRIAKG